MIPELLDTIPYGAYIGGHRGAHNDSVHKHQWRIWKFRSVLDADSLNCPCGIVGLDTPEEKKVNQKLLLKFLLRKFSSEEVEASQDEGAS